MTGGLELNIDGAVARLTINRPDAGNMLTLAMVSELAGLVADAGARPRRTYKLNSGQPRCDARRV